MCLFLVLAISVFGILRLRLCIEFVFNPALSVKGRVWFFSFPLYPYSEKKRRSETIRRPKNSPNRFVASLKEAVSLNNLLDKRPPSFTLSLKEYHLVAGAAQPSDTAFLHQFLCGLSLALFSLFDCIFPHFSVENVSVTPSFTTPCFNGMVKGRISLSLYDFLRLVLYRYKFKLPKKGEQT